MASIEDDGVAVHYTAVTRGTPVISSDGQRVGKVVEVLDNYREHIFDGLVIETTDGVRRFVDAPEVARTAERAVTLNIDAAEVAKLGPPEGGPGVGGSVKRLFGGLRRR
jgi:sporulation protein YlmC with PRC-barrel domain